MTTTYTHYAGDSVTLQMTVTDTDGNDVSFVGSSIVYKILPERGTTALVTKSTAAGTITVSGNVLSIALEPSDTADLDGLYRHTLVETTADDDVYTLLADDIVIEVA